MAIRRRSRFILLLADSLLWFRFALASSVPQFEARDDNLKRSKYLLSYVYWTVHHLDSWIKRDQLDVTCFIISLFNAYHVSDINTSILRTLRLICWVISWLLWFWFNVCWCYVVVWLWWCGIRMQTEALVPQPAYGYHTTPGKPQRNTNIHRTRAIQPMK